MKFKRCLGFVLVLSLLLSCAPALAAEENNLENAQITVESVVYNGSEQYPEVIVKLNNKLLIETEDYKIDGYYRNKNVGDPSHVQISGMGAYTGVIKAYFKILPKEINVFFADLCVKGYDGSTAAEPKLKADVLPGDNVTVTYSKAEYDDPNVGANIKVTASGLSLTGADADNYTLASPSVVGDGQITPQIIRLPSGETLAQGGNTLDLKKLISADGCDLNFVLGNANALGCTISNGVLTSGSESGSVSIEVIADGCDINGDTTAEWVMESNTFTVQIVKKETQDPVVIQPTEPSEPSTDPVYTNTATVTYGKPLSLSAVGGTGSGAVTYEVIELDGKASISPSGVLTPTKAGKVRVKAWKAGDDRYQDAPASAIEVTILPATLTITAPNRTARVGDAAPGLSTGWTVTGLVGGDKLAQNPTLSYASTPNMSQPGTVEILVSGAQVPEGGNYNPNIQYVPGKLTIQENPVYTITVLEPENGTLAASRTTAEAGERVGITVQPAEGYELKKLSVRADTGTDPRVAETGEGQYTFAMPESNVTISVAFQEQALPPVVLPFTDVREGDWFYQNVAYVYQNGLMNGTSATTFSPHVVTTRGMIVTILYRMAGSPQAPAWSPFADVASEKYYATPVAWAAWHGVVNGKSSTTFAPEEPITREQMAAIFYRYAETLGRNLSARGDLSQFIDQDKIHDYARVPIAWANGEGIIAGKGQGRLDPRGPATRAQAAAILQRFSEMIASS